MHPEGIVCPQKTQSVSMFSKFSIVLFHSPEGSVCPPCRRATKCFPLFSLFYSFPQRETAAPAFCGFCFSVPKNPLAYSTPREKISRLFAPFVDKKNQPQISQMDAERLLHLPTQKDHCTCSRTPIAPLIPILSSLVSLLSLALDTPKGEPKAKQRRGTGLPRPYQWSGERLTD